MKLHEYQAKALLKEVGANVPPGIPATTAQEALAAAQELGGNFWVVKAQVHAGGRGKGRFKHLASDEDLKKVLAGEKVDGKGGVALCTSLAEVTAAAETMLGNTLVTKQTGLGGVKVNTIFVTVGADIAREIYAAVLLDRQTSKILLMCSVEGGTEIEEVVEENDYEDGYEDELEYVEIKGSSEEINKRKKLYMDNNYYDEIENQNSNNQIDEIKNIDFKEKQQLNTNLASKRPIQNSTETLDIEPLDEQNLVKDNQ
ncbi:MAG: ATP-grasp domain-containing protein, partial [Myxococcota bacterium]|nr:ATP-grasp domain-containing protein [Myxococcota bacterium]